MLELPLSARREVFLFLYMIQISFSFMELLNALTSFIHSKKHTSYIYTHMCRPLDIHMQLYIYTCVCCHNIEMGYVPFIVYVSIPYTCQRMAMIRMTLYERISFSTICSCEHLTTTLIIIRLDFAVEPRRNCESSR